MNCSLGKRRRFVEYTWIRWTSFGDSALVFKSRLAAHLSNIDYNLSMSAKLELILHLYFQTRVCLAATPEWWSSQYILWCARKLDKYCWRWSARSTQFSWVHYLMAVICLLLHSTWFHLFYVGSHMHPPGFLYIYILYSTSLFDFWNKEKTCTSCLYFCNISFLVQWHIYT